jgi:spore germination protein YaaH
MEKYHFSDLNIDIESFRVVSREEQKLFTKFLKVVSTEMKERKLGTLSIDVSPTALIKRYLINVGDIEPLVNTIILMTYDYHYSGSYSTGPVAPLNGAPEVTEFDVETGVKEALNVVPSRKILLGIPLYGYEWETLSDTPGAAIIPGTAATASNRRVETLLTSCRTCISGFDEKAKEPYIIFPDEKVQDYHQIYYENKESIEKKILFSQQYNLGGVAFWALGYEGKSILEPVAAFKSHILWQ